MKKKKVEEIPGINVEAVSNFQRVGIDYVEELVGRDPDELYLTLCRLKKKEIEKVMLYIFRYAVYYAETPEPDPSLLNWWSWKD